MVVFTCSACGESLKKKDVEKHYFTKCRDCNLLTCIDCNKDFWGDAYKEHIKCVTEAERYGGKDFKAPVFKGEAKQQEWIDLLSNITSTRDVSPRVREVFQKMQAFNNIPRKEKPFKNFLGSSMGVRNPSLAEEVWKTIQEALQSAQKSKPGNSGKQQPPQQGQDKNENSTGGEKPQNNGADEEKGEQAQQQQPKKRKSDGAESQLPAKKKKHRQENGVNQSSAPEEGDAPSEEATEGKQAQQQQPKKRKSDGAKSQLPAKKKKHCQENGVGQGSAPEEDQAAKKPKLQKENKDDAAEEAEDEQESVKKARFKWKKTIKETLLNAENCQMSMNLLKKTVFDKYRNQGGLLSEEDVQTKFDKVLSNQRYFEHKGGKVRYVKS
ncbi:uncharacterized protein LOC144155968 isoform X4 [Haemaphysalis longicornis]